MAGLRFVLLAAAILLMENAVARQTDQAVGETAFYNDDTQRLLRLHTLEGDDASDEERGLNPFGGVKDPDKVFAKLGLARVQELAENLNNGEKWFKAIAKYRVAKKADMYFPDEYIYSTLQKTHSEGDIALFFQSLKRRTDVKPLAKDLQQEQFRAWFRQGYQQADVERLLGVTYASLEASDPRAKIVTKYVMHYVGGYVGNVRNY